MLTVDAPRSAAAIKPDRRPHAVVIGSGLRRPRGSDPARRARLSRHGPRAARCRPAAAPMSTGRMASPSTPARPSSPRRSSSRSSGQLCGRTARRRRRRCAPIDAVLPDPLRRRRDVRLQRRPRRRCGRRSRASRRATWRATSASCARARPSSASGSRSSATPISARRWTCCASLPDLLRLGGLPHASTALVSAYIRDERLRPVFSFHPLLIGGNPFRATPIYCLIAFLERHWGVHFAMGGTGTAGRRAGRADRRPGRRGALRCRGGAASSSRMDVRPACASARARGSPLESWSRTPIRPGPTATCCRRTARRRWTDTQDRAHSATRWGCSSGTSARSAIPDVAHHTIMLGPRYRGLLDDIFKRKVLAEDFSLYLHRPTATDPSLAPPGCDAFYVLSPVPNLAGGQDWSPMRRALPPRHRRAPLRDAAARPRGRVGTSLVTTPPGFPGQAPVLPRLRRSAWSRS